MRRALTLLILILFAGCGLPGAAPVEETLEKAAANLERFFTEAGLVASVEHVEQAKYDAKGKVLSRKQADYDYLVMMQLAGNELLTQETREFRGDAEKRPSQPLLLTKGFSLLSLVLHPHFQSSFLFADLTTPEDGQHGLRRLSFSYLPGLRSPSVLQLRGKDYPIPWKGSVWLDANSGEVARIAVELADSLKDLGVESMTAVVSYQPVRFEDGSRAISLPKEASVTLRTRHQQWHNVHRYAEYRHFRVSTTVEVGKPREGDGDTNKH